MDVWIEVATQAWGQLVRPGTNQPLANSVPSINTTVRATASDTGTVIAPADWKSDKDGLLPGFVAEGTWLFIEPDGQSRQVEAISGGVVRVATGKSAMLPNTAPTITFETPTGYVKQYTDPDASLRWRWRSFAAGSVRQFGAYFDPDGGFNTGLSIVCSNKRRDDGSIQDVSALVLPAHEPSMVSVSPDVNGPSLAIEASGTRGAGKTNQTALAVYNLDEIHSGAGANTAGYGKKRFEIDGKGTMQWGLNLSDNGLANFDVRLDSVGLGLPHRGLKIVANDDCSVIELHTDGSVVANRNWRMAANYDGAGQLDFVRSVDSTGAPTSQVIATMLGTGDLRLPVAAKGIIVKSPDGLVTKRIGIDNAGALSITTP